MEILFCLSRMACPGSLSKCVCVFLALFAFLALCYLPNYFILNLVGISLQLRSSLSMGLLSTTSPAALGKFCGNLWSRSARLPVNWLILRAVCFQNSIAPLAVVSRPAAHFSAWFRNMSSMWLVSLGSQTFWSTQNSHNERLLGLSRQIENRDDLLR